MRSWGSLGHLGQANTDKTTPYRKMETLASRNVPGCWRPWTLETSVVVVSGAVNK